MLHHVVEESLLGQQLLWAADLENVPRAHDHHPIIVHSRLQPVGDCNQRSRIASVARELVVQQNRQERRQSYFYINRKYLEITNRTLAAGVLAHPHRIVR